MWQFIPPGQDFNRRSNGEGTMQVAGGGASLRPGPGRCRCHERHGRDGQEPPPMKRLVRGERSGPTKAVRKDGRSLRCYSFRGPSNIPRHPGFRLPRRLCPFNHAVWPCPCRIPPAFPDENTTLRRVADETAFFPAACHAYRLLNEKHPPKRVGKTAPGQGRGGEARGPGVRASAPPRERTGGLRCRLRPAC